MKRALLNVQNNSQAIADFAAQTVEKDLECYFRVFYGGDLCQRLSNPNVSFLGPMPSDGAAIATVETKSGFCFLADFVHALFEKNIFIQAVDSESAFLYKNFTINPFETKEEYFKSIFPSIDTQLELDGAIIDLTDRAIKQNGEWLCSDFLNGAYALSGNIRHGVLVSHSKSGYLTTINEIFKEDL